MKQTAVNWLIEQLNLIEWIEDDGLPHIHLKIVEKAKEMEKEQMNLSEIKGISNTINYKNSIAEISDTEVEFAGTNAWVEYNFNVSDDAESFYAGWKLAIKWYREQLKSKI